MLLSRGTPLRLRSGITVVILERASKNGWNCVVVFGNTVYPRGGYDIFVFDEDLREASEVDWPASSC